MEDIAIAGRRIAAEKTTTRISASIVRRDITSKTSIPQHHPQVLNGTSVNKGQQRGLVTDPYGQCEKKIKSPISGVVNRYKQLPDSEYRRCAPIHKKARTRNP